MGEELNPVNAGQEDVVDSQMDGIQEEQGTDETVNAGEGEVANPEEKKPVQSPEENAKIAAARRTAEAKAKDEIIAELFGQEYGIKTYTEYQAALAKQQEQERLAELTQNNIPEEVAKEIIENRKFREEAKAKEYDLLIEQKKAALKDKPYFAELEADIDNLVKDSKSRGQLIDLEVAYKYLRGEKMEELLSKTEDDAVKRTIANVHDRAKRGVGALSSDAGSTDADITGINLDMAAAFGNDPKEIAKYVKKQSRS